MEQAIYLAMMAIVDENTDLTDSSEGKNEWDTEENGVPGFIWYAATDRFPVMVNRIGTRAHYPFAIAAQNH